MNIWILFSGDSHYRGKHGMLLVVYHWNNTLVLQHNLLKQTQMSCYNIKRYDTVNGLQLRKIWPSEYYSWTILTRGKHGMLLVVYHWNNTLVLQHNLLKQTQMSCYNIKRYDTVNGLHWRHIRTSEYYSRAILTRGEHGMLLVAYHWKL